MLRSLFDLYYWNCDGTDPPADLNLEEYVLQWEPNYLAVFILFAGVLLCMYEITLLYR